MPLKILVAEDDRHTRRILEHIFTKDPAFRDQETQLLLAPDGEEALKLFEKERPDLVISDLLMPRLDGFALCRAIRRLPYGKDVPVIVTSAIYKETALLNRMREELSVEFYAKPFQVRELVKGVQRLLDRRQKVEAAGGGRPTRQERPKRRTQEMRRLQGDLAERPLAKLLLDLLEEQATGVLTLRRGQIKKEVFIVHGAPVGAESNIRTETLGHYLVAKSVLDEQQHERALVVAKEQHVSVMEAIAKIGFLSESDVLRHHTALAKLKIINSLRWHDGTYAFLPGDNFSDRMPKAAIDVTNILLLGLQRVTSLDEASKRLDAMSSHRIRLTERVERYQEVFLKVFGDEVLRLLPSSPTLNELLRKGVEPLKAYLHTHALLETGMAELGEAVEESPGAAVRTEDPIGLHQLKQEATKAPEKKKAASEEGAEEVLYEELFGVDEISVVTAMPVQTQERVRPPADSGEVAIAIQFEEGAESMPLPLTTAEARKLVNSTYLGVHDRTHYELLGVEPSASTARIREACETLRKTFAVERFKDCDLGLDHPKLEEINYMISQAEAVLLDAKARARYDEELKESARAGKPDPIEAEMLLRSGETLIAQGHFAQAVSALARAVELDPESPDCWAALGWARHGAKPGDQEVGIEAERDIERALTLSPDDPHALRYLGLLRAALGQDDRAISALERALDIDPGRKDVFEALAGIHAARGDWKLLERQHRLVLHRLGSRDASRTVALWKSLAAVYRDQLGDIESARTSLEVAAKLAPTDEEIQGALEALQRPDPGRWRERAEVLLGQLSKQPAERAPLEELFRLYSAVEQPDRAYLAASLLARHGAMDQGAQDLLRRFQPRFLLRVRRDVDGEIWSRIRHLQDDPETCTLFETLATLPPDFDFEAAPVDDIGQPVEPDSTPATFGRVLSYLCGLLALPTPPLRQRARRQGEEEGPCRVLGPIASQLMVEDALLASEDALAIAIHLSRVLPYFWAGRAFGAALGPKELRNVLMAAMKVISPRLKTDDPGGSIGRIHERLMQAPAEFREGLTGVITALTRERSSLNITRWIKGMAISADRLALVIVADPELLLRHHPAGSSAEIVEEIQSYALSEPHLELRALLGTSVVV